MAEKSRWTLRGTVLGALATPLLLVLGFQIPILAHFAWKKLRVPYVIAMPLLFAAEMAAVDWLCFGPEHRPSVLLVHGGLLLLVALGSLLSALFPGEDRRERLTEGPTNVEGFIPAHIIFLLTTLLLPAIFNAIDLARANLH
jgi:hypothetical protein